MDPTYYILQMPAFLDIPQCLIVLSLGARTPVRNVPDPRSVRLSGPRHIAETKHRRGPRRRRRSFVVRRSASEGSHGRGADASAQHLARRTPRERDGIGKENAPERERPKRDLRVIWTSARRIERVNDEGADLDWVARV